MRGCSVGDIIVYHSLGRETNTSNPISIVMTPTADDKDNTSSDLALAECYLCQALTDSSCPQCGLASCPHHLSSHLNTDNICLPFIIKYKEGVGRYVVASRDIKPNEVSNEQWAKNKAPRGFWGNAQCHFGRKIGIFGNFGGNIIP